MAGEGIDRRDKEWRRRLKMITMGGPNEGLIRRSPADWQSAVVVVRGCKKVKSQRSPRPTLFSATINRLMNQRPRAAFTNRHFRKHSLIRKLTRRACFCSSGLSWRPSYIAALYRCPVPFDEMARRISHQDSGGQSNIIEGPAVRLRASPSVAAK